MSRRVFPPTILALLLATAIPAVAQDASFPDLAWKIDRRVQNARRAFPSPVDARVVYVAAEQGLWKTTDAGGDWRLIAKTGASDLGTISSIAVCPARPESLALGSCGKGLFLSDDGGLTWRKGGGVEAGLISEKVHAVMFNAEDRAWRTLMALHGPDAAGISKSIDGGSRWRAIALARYFRAISGSGQVLIASSAPVDVPEGWQLARSINYGESWNILQRDGLPSDGARAILPSPADESKRQWPHVWGQRDGRLLTSVDDGRNWEEAAVAPAGRWQCVFATPGRTPAENRFWAYDPFLNGLLVGNDFKTPWTSRSRGLYVHRMIRGGANVAADAAGLRFYACINGMLYVADHVPDAEDGPTIRMVEADPPVLDLGARTAGAAVCHEILQSAQRIVEGASIDAEIPALAKSGREVRELADRRRFRVRVRVEHPGGPAEVRSVVVTPDLFDVGPVTLVDDGRHDDGAAGDGVWGGEFRFAGDRLWNDRQANAQGRLSFPGTRAIPVTAEDAAGRKTQWTLPLTIFFEPRPLEVLYDPSINYQQTLRGACVATGAVKMSNRKDAGPDGTWGLDIAASKGPWEAGWIMPNGSDVDITGLDYAIFAFRGTPGSGDVEFYLVDEIVGPMRYGRDKLEPQIPSRALALVKGGYLPAMDGQFHVVKVPVMDLVRDMRFMRRHLAGFSFRPAEGSAGGTYTVGEVRFANE